MQSRAEQQRKLRRVNHPSMFERGHDYERTANDCKQPMGMQLCEHEKRRHAQDKKNHTSKPGEPECKSPSPCEYHGNRLPHPPGQKRADK
ncbi:hypothetical protein PAT3040_03981 [Paenibacillus agaridevorans]|uniref:Uncharacterized protein n=1 Tax=Paenibacillus agaridevorans TaxID=171404 RepID=A0A2R5ERZ8_9BACL|nr:hypothetical protein PAT3040_03981 [Paenibacillus agaridevorans]